MDQRGASGERAQSPPLIDYDSDGLGSEEQRRSQICGLEEEQGRLPLPEVDVPPGFESDDDIPLKQSGNWSGRASSLEPFLRSETQLNSNLTTGNDSPLESRTIERAESLEEFEKMEEEVMRQIESEHAAEGRKPSEEEMDQTSDDDEDAAPSFQNRQSVTDIKYTNLPFEMSVEEDEDVESLGHVPPEPPMGPPPAYTPDRAEPAPLKRISSTIGGSGSGGGGGQMAGIGGMGTGLMGAVGEMGGLAATAALGVAGFGGIHHSNRSITSHSSEHSDYEDDQHNRQLPLTQQQELLFRYVDEFKPEDWDIEPKLAPFIVDYIPAIGDCDPFIKIPRPDGIDDNLGIVVIDEPAVDQTDPVIMEMRLRMNLKSESAKEVAVKQIERADKNSDVIEQWIKNIKELHAQKPSTSVTFKQPMPDLDKLMQEWPPEMEQLLNEVKLPSADLDASLEEYTDLCLNLVDIPVQKSRIESLHALFSLYLVFKQSQHFRSLAANTMMEDKSTTDRLEL